MIRFQCPVCGKILKAEDQGAGRKANCPRCGQRLWIPPPVRVIDQPPIPDQPSNDLYNGSTPQGQEPFDELTERYQANGGTIPVSKFARNLGLALALVGLVIILVGLAILLYFWLIYDPTVPEYPGITQFRVYNIGRMQNRNIGIWIGIAFTGIGFVASLFGVSLGLRNGKS
jgi:DNA-directed RNA polymerase subunit RPC12/RpoP